MEEKEIPSLSKNCLEGPLAKKHAGDKKVIDKKKKEKKKVLKRLWYNVFVYVNHVFIHTMIVFMREEKWTQLAFLVYMMSV